MKTDERLNTLCKEFAGLDEDEKDYILGVSQVLIGSVFKTNPMPLFSTGISSAVENMNIYVEIRSI